MKGRLVHDAFGTAGTNTKLNRLLGGMIQDLDLDGWAGDE